MKFRKITFSVFIFSLVFPISCFASDLLTKNLSIGVSDKEVLSLQKILNMDVLTQISSSGIGSKGNETEYFGLKTKEAVIKFQNKYADDVLKPVGLTQGTGYVGFYSRKKLNQLGLNLNKSASTSINTNLSTTTIFNSLIKTNVSTTSASTTNSKIPTIKTISPTVLLDGGTLTIIGTNFTASNTVFLSVDFPNKHTGVPSKNNGTRIDIQVSTPFGEKLRESLIKVPSEIRSSVLQKVIEGIRKDNNLGESSGSDLIFRSEIYIKNENGESEKKKLDINILKDL